MSTKIVKSESSNRVIVAVPGDNGACGRYRILNPARCAQEILNLDVTVSPAGKYRMMAKCDTLWTQRVCSKMTLDAIRDLKNRTGIEVFCDYDDLTWMFENETIPEYNVCSKRIDTESNMSAMKEMLESTVDRVSVSTELLKSSISQFYPEDRITVLPNCLRRTEWSFGLDCRIPAKPVFGFFGSATHVGSAKSRELGDFDSGLVQYLSDKPMMTIGFKPWMFDQAEVHKWAPMWMYPQHFHNIGRRCTFIVAPLRENIFNKCKSDLKYLECAAIGRVCLCSSFPDSPYESIAHEYQKIPAGATKQTVKYIVDRALKNYDEILDHQYRALQSRWLESNLDKYSKFLQ